MPVFVSFFVSLFYKQIKLCRLTHILEHERIRHIVLGKQQPSEKP